MNKSHKTLSLVCGILGISFAGISYLIFAFLSIPGLILGIVSIVYYFIDKKDNQETSTAALVCGILAVVFGSISAILLIISLVLSLKNAMATMAITL